MRRGHTIYSIFGQIEEVVALEMIEEHRLHKIEARMIPQSVRVNSAMLPAKFAVMMPNRLIAEFEARIEALRA